jgi:predicted acylesterase/phospholipase RssA
VTNEDLFDYKALAILSGGFVKGARLEEFLLEHVKNRRSKISPPFAAVATDLVTGTTVVFSRGPARRARLLGHPRRAFVPVTIEGQTLVDGVTNPSRRMFGSLGADVVIGGRDPAGGAGESSGNP